MSTLEVSNLNDGTTTVATTFVTNGSAKCWVNFNGSGTIATRDSLNVASLTDNGTGDYYVNLTNAMGNAGYSCTTGGRVSGGISCNDGGDQTASRLALGALDSGGSRDDADQICSEADGDLA